MLQRTCYICPLQCGVPRPLPKKRIKSKNANQSGKQAHFWSNYRRHAWLLTVTIPDIQGKPPNIIIIWAKDRRRDEDLLTTLSLSQFFLLALIIWACWWVYAETLVIKPWFRAMVRSASKRMELAVELPPASEEPARQFLRPTREQPAIWRGGERCGEFR